MSGWGDNRWGGGDFYDDDAGWHPMQGGSAASYDFHQNKKGNRQGDYGNQKWQYDPAANTSWSTAADDDDGYNQPWQSDFDQPFDNNGNSYVGWRNSMGSGFQNQNVPVGPAKFRGSSSMPPQPHPGNSGYGYGQGGEDAWYEDRDGYQDGPPAPKRARDWRSRGRRGRGRHQRGPQDWDEGGYGYAQGEYDEGYHDYWGEAESHWGGAQQQGWYEDDYYYGNEGGMGYGDWSQIPPSTQPTSWQGQEVGYDDSYTTQFDYGAGYEGGYEDPRVYYENDGGDMQHGRPERKRVEDLPDDKLIYKRHRQLTAEREGREHLFRLIKNTMKAMKAASDVMSEELKQSKTTNVEVNEGTKDDENSEEPTGATADTETPGGESSSSIKTEGMNASSGADKKGSLEKVRIEEKAAETEEASTQKTRENGEDKAKEKELPPQVLLGVVRVGTAVKRLLSKDLTHYGSELVAVFKCKPTKTHLSRLAELIKEKMSPILSKKVNIEMKADEEVIEITEDSETTTKFPIIISLTSPCYGKDFEQEEKIPEEEPPSDLLNEKRCINALAKIRQVRWTFKKHSSELEKPVVRILLDISTRLPEWQCLTPYTVEVLVHTVMEKLSKDVRESELHISRLFVQCLEVLAEGIVLPDGPGLKDPCESEPVDVFAYLTLQQAEDLTRAAQKALRVVACNRVAEVLNV